MAEDGISKRAVRCRPLRSVSLDFRVRSWSDSAIDESAFDPIDFMTPHLRLRLPICDSPFATPHNTPTLQPQRLVSCTSQTNTETKQQPRTPRPVNSRTVSPNRSVSPVPWSLMPPSTISATTKALFNCFPSEILWSCRHRYMQQKWGLGDGDH